MNARERTIRKFNPGTLQSDEEVKAQFVVRERELEIVLETLRGNIRSPSCQHILLIAPRGQGKTMLLARVAAELRTHEELSECFFPVQFMEESHEILTVADFWLETLFHLARECKARDPALADELSATHADLASRWREREIAERVRAAVLEAADRLGKRLVLMVENLQELCRSADDDFGWQLRCTLQSEPQIVLLASATGHFAQLSDVREPFFEFFRIVSLEPLDTEACRRLWQVVSGEAASDHEIRPLQILTGGNPRLLVIVGSFARHRSLRRLMEDLVALIDEHTEYFRSHLEGLPKVERRVYLAAIDLWRPSSSGEIATRARMGVRTVSAMLGRLCERGMVAAEGTDRKRLYAAAERLYGIYYKLRRERDEAAIVHVLIRFMAAFYSGSELAEISSGLLREAERFPAIREGLKRATNESPSLRNVFDQADERIVADDTASVSQTETIKELIHRGFAALDRLGKPEAALAAWDEAVERCEADGTPEARALVGSVLISKGFVALDRLGKPEVALAVFDQTLELCGTDDAPEARVLVSSALVGRGFALDRLGKPEEALAAWNEAVEHCGTDDAPEARELVASALLASGFALDRLGKPEAALAAFDETVERCGADDMPVAIRALVASALIGRGRLLRRLGKPETALAASDEVVERFGTDDAPEVRALAAAALVDKGYALYRLREHEAALSVWDQALERCKTDDVPETPTMTAHALSGKCRSQILLGQSEEAVRTCDKLERRFCTLTDDDGIAFGWRAQWVKITALLVQGQHSAAMGTLRSAYSGLDPGNDAMLSEVLNWVPFLIAAKASERDLVDILSADGEKSVALTPLLVALRQRLGQTVREPTEVMEVAADVRAAIENVENASIIPLRDSGSGTIEGVLLPAPD